MDAVSFIQGKFNARFDYTNNKVKKNTLTVSVKPLVSVSFADKRFLSVFGNKFADTDDGIMAMCFS